MPCGVVLRELLKQYEDVASILLHDQSREGGQAVSIDEIDPTEAPAQSGEGVFWKFFSWIEDSAFEVSTDAFTTFRVPPPNQTHCPIRLLLIYWKGALDKTQTACRGLP